MQKLRLSEKSGSGGRLVEGGGGGDFFLDTDFVNVLTFTSYAGPIRFWVKRKPLMPLTTHLTQKKAAILGRWLTTIYESYPPETAIFLRKEKDRFDNPMGYRISEGLAGLYDALLQDTDRDQVLTCLDENRRAGLVGIRCLHQTPGKAPGYPGRRSEAQDQRPDAQIGHQ
jgi:hypothetical protein